MSIQLKLVTHEDGRTQLMVTQVTLPTEQTKAALLNLVFHRVFNVGLIDAEQFQAFRVLVMATDLSDEGLAPTLNVCPDCGRHVQIVTFAGKTRQLYSFETVQKSLIELMHQSLITADEATALEANVREALPELPETDPDMVLDIDDYANILASLIQYRIIGNPPVRPDGDVTDNASSDVTSESQQG